MKYSLDLKKELVIELNYGYFRNYATGTIFYAYLLFLFYLFIYFFQKHLVQNPAYRITAEEAMQHPYFNDLSPSVKNM